MTKELITATGRTRYRISTSLFRKPVLVLQVELRVQGTHLDEHGFGPSFNILGWRDAILEDVQIEVRTQVIS